MLAVEDGAGCGLQSVNDELTVELLTALAELNGELGAPRRRQRRR